MHWGYTESKFVKHFDGGCLPAGFLVRSNKLPYMDILHHIWLLLRSGADGRQHHRAILLRQIRNEPLQGRFDRLPIRVHELLLPP